MNQLVMLSVAFCLAAAAGTAGAAGAHKLSDRVSIELGEPVVVAMSRAGERRWGYYHGALLSTYPGGRLLLRFRDCPDAVSAYGTPQPTFISADEGKTWKTFSEPGFPTRCKSLELGGGEFICVPSPKPLNIHKPKLKLPQPVGERTGYVKTLFYKLEDCPKKIQDFVTTLPAARWTPKTKRWTTEQIKYPVKGALLWKRAAKHGNLIARTWFHHAPVRLDDELIYADYRQAYLGKDDSVSKHWSAACMVSRDNGRTWRFRSTLAVDPKGVWPMCEPDMDVNAAGELACVLRRTHRLQKSMVITFSKDRGKTWTEPTDLKDPLGDFGVMPDLLSLKCGVMALSYGRPGVCLSFSLDGLGRKWTKPIPIVRGSHKDKNADSDGYTGMVPLGPNCFLLAYQKMRHKDNDGKVRKAILVRRVTLRQTRPNPPGRARPPAAKYAPAQPAEPGAISRNS